MITNASIDHCTRPSKRQSSRDEDHEIPKTYVVLC